MTYAYLSNVDEITAPPCSLKNDGTSVPPPKKDIRNGVFVIIMVLISNVLIMIKSL